MLATGCAITFTMSPAQSSVYTTEDASVSFTLTNNGATAINNALVTLGVPIDLGGNRTFNAPSLSAGASFSKTVKIVTLDNTPLMNYSITGTVSYGGQVIDYPPVYLNVVQFPVSLSYKFLKDSMSAGSENTLVVMLKNNGTDSLTNLNININYPGGFITNSSKNLYLPQMAPNLELRQELMFIAPADANGDYHIGISADFSSNGVTHTIETFAKVYVSGSASLNWLETLLTIIIVILIGLILLGRAR